MFADMCAQRCPCFVIRDLSVVAPPAIVSLGRQGVQWQENALSSAHHLQILERMDVPFETVDVLFDDTLRSGLKEYSQVRCANLADTSRCSPLYDLCNTRLTH